MITADWCWFCCIKGCASEFYSVGVPGRVVIQDSVRLFDDLDQIHLPDPVMQDIENLKQENARLKKRLAHLENSVNESRSSYDDN